MRIVYAALLFVVSGAPAFAQRVPTIVIPGRPDVPVIMITAYGDADTKRKALERGADALFTKPIDFMMLRNEIDTRVEQAA